MEGRPELIDYLAVLNRRRAFILSGTLLITAVAVLTTFVMTSYYMTEATVMVSPSKVSSEGMEPPRPYIEVESYVSLFENNSIELQAIERFGLREAPWGLTLPKFRRLVRVRQVPQTDLISVQFSFPDPELSQKIASFLVQNAVERNRELNQAEALDAQKLVEAELERARVRRDQLRDDLADYRKSHDFTALRAQLDAYAETYASLDTARRKTEGEVAEAEASPLGRFLLPGYQAKLQRLNATIEDLKRQADGWTQEYAIRRQGVEDRTDRYESADKVVAELESHASEARVLVGSRSVDLKLIDVPFLPEERSWPRRGLVAFVAAQVGLLGMILLAFLLDYIALRRSRL